MVRARTTRTSRKAASATPAPAGTDGNSQPTHSLSGAKTAVVVVHGIGEQRPLETLREFVETVYRRDLTMASMAPDATGMLDVSIAPDDTTGSAELRRITTLSDGPLKRTDFFEFYWADIMDGTPLDMVTGWIRTLLLRSPWRLPKSRKVIGAWLILWALAVVIVTAGIITVHPELAVRIEAADLPGKLAAWLQPIDFLWSWLEPPQPKVGGLLIMIAGLVLAVRIARAGGVMSAVSLGWPVVYFAGGLILAMLPEALVGSVRFWAGLVTAGAGWAMHALVTPFAGDVVRYIRATPRTVERRRLVRERGLALLEALHRKRLSGPPVENFSQVDNTSNPPLYDRLIIVGHSLGSIIAYDILQLFWEKHGPTHHQGWDAADAGVQAALMGVDAYVKAEWREPKVAEFDQAGFDAARQRLFTLLRDNRPGWRISDFITLGSPLAHAEFLLTDSSMQVEQALKERRLATSPPHPDPLQNGSMLFRATPPAGTEREGEEGSFYPHFAAQFAAVKWTNIHDEHANPLLGDLVSGKLEAFGRGIEEHDLAITCPSRPGWLSRLFTHTQYWKWHDSYEPSPEAMAEAAALRGSGRPIPQETLQSLLWDNLPSHIRQLRLALRLWT